MINPLYYLIAKLSIAFLLFSSGLYYVYNKGYQHAEAECEKIVKEYKETINAKIDNIELLAGTLSKDLKNTEVTISKDLKTIIVNGRKAPPTIIVDGKCMPSEEYKASIQALHKKANEALK